MNVRELIKKEIIKAIKTLNYGENAGETAKVKISERPIQGDYSTSVALVLAAKAKKSPLEIAEDLKNKLSLPGNLKKYIEKMEVLPPGFLNFFVKKEILADSLIKITCKKEKFWSVKKKKETIVVEYSSPNIAKPLGAHHLRSTVIGQALVNILRFDGRRAISLSFPGDWGTQFGVLLAAYKKWGDNEKLKKNPIAEMLNLYVRFSKAAKEDPKLKDDARLEFKKLEDGDKENLKIWKWFYDESMKGFNKVYKTLGVKIENTIGESFYNPILNRVIEDSFEKGIAEKGGDGSIVIRFKDAPPELIRKSDGATLFTTRELVSIKHRIKKWKADKLLYLADNGQTFHLSQVFSAAELLGYAKKEQLIHIKFGVMLAPGKKKFATREGRLIPLEEVLNESCGRAKKIVEKLNPEIPAREKEKIARIVGVGAVKFSDLHQNRLSDVVFDWDKMLNLKGGSAPYIQYTYARIKSVMKKAKFKSLLLSGRVLAKNLSSEKEIAIARQIIHFEEIIEDAAERYMPNFLAEYLLELAEKLNSFYEELPILKAEPDSRKARLILISAAALTIKKGLNLLGIEAPERM